MAALLRGNRLCQIGKVISQLGRSNVSTTSRLPAALSYQSFGSTVNNRSATQLSHEQGAVSPLLAADQHLNMLDREVRRIGRVTSKQVEDIYATIKKAGEVTNQQALLLLRCLGTVLAEEHPARRTQLANDVWGTLQELGAKYDVTHYNALLRVYLQNQHVFDPAQFLASMEQAGVLANRVTYQRLMARYCEIGDIQGASQILQHMKDHAIPINEAVFNSLITGHMRAGQVEEATGVMEAMRENELVPRAETYLAMACGYAENDNMEMMKQVLADAESADIGLASQHYLELAEVLIKKDKQDQIQEYLEIASEKIGYNQSAINSIYQLISTGHEDAAFQIYSTMNKPVIDNIADQTLGRFFIKAMVKHERPLEKLESIMESMRENGLNQDKLDWAAQWALQYGKPDYAIAMFRKMNDIGLPIRSHYFWPLCRHYGNTKDKEGVYKTIALTKELTGRVTDGLMVLREYALTELVKLGENTEDIVQNIVAGGWTEDMANLSLISHMVLNKKAEEAVEFSKDKNVLLHFPTVKNVCNSLLYRTRNADLLLRMMESVQGWARGRGGVIRVNSEVLQDLLFTIPSTEANGQLFTSLIEGMVEKDMRISSACFEEIKDKLEKFNIPQETTEKLSQLVVDDNKRFGQRGTQEFSREELNQKSIEELQVQAAESKNLKAVGKVLLQKYCYAGNIEGATELKGRLDEVGFIYNAYSLRDLATLAVEHKKDVEESLGYLKDLESKYPDFKQYQRLVLKIACLLAETERTEEAIGLLKDHHVRHGGFMLEQGLQDSYELSDTCSRLVKACTARGDMAAAKQALDTVTDCGFLKPDTYSLLKEYMQGFLDKKDSAGALQAMGELQEKYQRLPLFDQVINMLIEEVDPEGLQKVVDLGSAQFGEMEVLHKLMVAFVECGKLKEAKKITETPGMRAMMPRLIADCERLVKQNKTTELENLVKVTEGLFEVDRDDMLFQLMRGYLVNKHDYQCAMEVYTQYEEENVLPRGRTLRYLAKAMENIGQPVPFEVPAVGEHESDRRPKRQGRGQEARGQETRGKAARGSPSSGAQRKAVDLVNAGEFEKVQEMSKQFEEKGEPSAMFMSEVAQELAKDKLKTGFRSFVNVLASKGDVESLLEVKEKVQARGLQFAISSAIFQAYVNSDRVGEIIKFLMDNPGEANKYLLLQNIRLLAEKSPGDIEQIETIIEEYTERTADYVRMNDLWTYYLCTGQKEKAEKLLQVNQELGENLRVVKACTWLKYDNNVQVLEELLGLVEKNHSNRVMVYSYVIGTHAKLGDWQSALDVVKQAAAAGIEVRQMRHGLLVPLEALLLENNQPLPWPVGLFAPKQKQEVGEASSDSSSSSDSSDYERK